MKIVFWGKGDRSVACLNALTANHDNKIVFVVSHPGDSVLKIASNSFGLQFACPEDPNQAEFESFLIKQQADLFVLAGYGKILKKKIFNIPRIMTINLHGGKLPNFRGSSPMNWALIRGEKCFSLSIIKVDSGVDTGDILSEKSFEISKDSTIKDLHALANENFPKMLCDLVARIRTGNCSVIRIQQRNEGAYYPLRFPDDGLILWDLLSAEEIHNRVRALTLPYTCAFTFLERRKILLIESKLILPPFYGEPGRIYKIYSSGEMYVGAKDMCVCINKAIFADNGNNIQDTIKRYQLFTTISNRLMDMARI